jgi:hypothetical protein
MERASPHNLLRGLAGFPPREIRPAYPRTLYDNE